MLKSTDNSQDRVYNLFCFKKFQFQFPKEPNADVTLRALQSGILFSPVLPRLPLPSFWLWSQCDLFNYVHSMTVSQ